MTVSTSTRRKSRLTAEERKAAIVKTAVRLFAEKGFRGTTTRELAQACGVSEPVLYQHFATKRELYSAIIGSICRVEQKDKDTALETARQAEDDEAFFTRLAELLLDWYEHEPEVIRLLLYSALEGHELSDLFYEKQIVVYYQMLTDYLAKRMEKGVFRKMDPYLAARAFTGTVSHQGMASTVFGLSDLQGTQKEIVRGLVNIFLNGIRV